MTETHRFQVSASFLRTLLSVRVHRRQAQVPNLILQHPQPAQLNGFAAALQGSFFSGQINWIVSHSQPFLQPLGQSFGGTLAGGRLPKLVPGVSAALTISRQTPRLLSSQAALLQERNMDRLLWPFWPISAG
jgi:hypothetical protein